MASGVPCLISTDPALCEVAGRENALPVNPYSVQDIAAGLYRLLGDAACREQLRRRGPARAALFTWQTCANQTYRLYGEAVACRGLAGRAALHAAGQRRSMAAAIEGCGSSDRMVINASVTRDR